MNTHIQLHLFATLKTYLPLSGNQYPIQSGVSIREVVQRLYIPEKEAKLIFINGVKADLNSVLHGGERVGIFPPVGGG